MKNNKGFATTFILFSLLIVFLIIMSVLMATLSNSSTLTSNLRNRLTDDVESPNIYKEYNFAATGDMQVFTAPASKVYTIEGWAVGTTNNSKYLKTTKYLKKHEQLYLYIGKNGSGFNSGKTDVRTVYLVKDPDPTKNIDNTAESVASIILDVDTNGVINNSKHKPDAAGSDGYVKIKYSSLTAKNIGYSNGNTHINCSNVQCAIDKINKIYNGQPTELCKAATASERHNSYGNLGPGLVVGRSFICDVNGDGKYNAENEMFYYLSDYYDTKSKNFNSDVAVLLYYSNVRYGQIENSVGEDKSKHIKYDESGENWHGPRTARAHLPTTAQWKNVTLYKTTRAILNEEGGSTTSGGTLPTDFSYAGYAARLATYQEINSALTFLLQNTNYDRTFLKENLASSSASYSVYVWNYWLETARASTSDRAYDVFHHNRTIVTEEYLFDWDNVSTNQATLVRPVIEVPKTELQY